MMNNVEKVQNLNRQCGYQCQCGCSYAKKKNPKESVSLLKGGPGGEEDNLLKIRAGKMTDDASHSFVPGIPGSHYQPDGFTPMLL